jgi:DNA replication protein DnaC
MQADTQSHPPQSDQASLNNPLGHSPTTAPDQAEALRILAQATAQTRQARAALPDQRLIPRSLVDRIAAVCEAAKNNPTAPDDEEEAAPVDREKRQMAERLVAACGVPRRYAGATLVLLGPREVQQTAANALGDLEHAPGIVALIGTRGTGKTWLACGLVLDFCRAGRRAFYMNAMDYFLELRSTFDDGSKMTQAKVEEKYLRPALLVLDEVHERGDTAWEDRTLTRIVNKRYEAELATVLISNQTPEQFAERVGASIADRIHDGGGVIRCEWPSLRGATA